MLTHHLTDPNGDPVYFKSGLPASFHNFNGNFHSFGSFNAFTGTFNGKNDQSYGSERQKQSKNEKLEMEISRLMEKNDGKLFIVKQERLMRDSSNEEIFGLLG